MRGQKRDLLRRIATADAPHHCCCPFIGAEGAHQGDEFIAAVIGLNGRNAMPPLSGHPMAALAATNQQWRIHRLRENGAS